MRRALLFTMIFATAAAYAGTRRGPASRLARPWTRTATHRHARGSQGLPATHGGLRRGGREQGWPARRGRAADPSREDARRDAGQAEERWKALTRRRRTTVARRGAGVDAADGGALRQVRREQGRLRLARRDAQLPHEEEAAGVGRCHSRAGGARRRPFRTARADPRPATISRAASRAAPRRRAATVRAGAAGRVRGRVQEQLRR